MSTAAQVTPEPIFQIASGFMAAKHLFVANEVGLGIVPDNTLARRFRDEAGWANQRIAALADEVIFMSAGLPLTLKSRSRSRASQRQRPSAPGRKA